MTTGLSRKGFDLDLRDGIAAENELAAYLTDKLIECKMDEKAVETGNLYVEYKCRGERSGIATTEAKSWAFRLKPGVWLLLDTKYLRKVASTCYNRAVEGGDDNLSLGVLVPIRKIIEGDGGWTR